jgi:single-strand DNA-binding protein
MFRCTGGHRWFRWHPDVDINPEGTMSFSVNKVILVGYVGRDPEIRTTQNGMSVAQISLATHYLSGSGPAGEGGEERTSWHRIVAWNRLAAVAERRLRKGARVYVEGYLAYDKYEREGITLPTTEIHAKELIVLNPVSTPDAGEVETLVVLAEGAEAGTPS